MSYSSSIALYNNIDYVDNSYKKTIEFSDRVRFVKNFPPTEEDALLQYQGYHHLNLRNSPGISSKRDALLLTVDDIKYWWKKTGIQLKGDESIIYMVQSVVDRYADLQKNKHRVGSEVTKKKRNEFVEKLQNTLWVVDKKYEEKLRNSTDKTSKEDWEYLQSVRGTNRKATLGCVDTKERKKLKRKRKRENLPMSKISIEDDTHFSTSSEEDTDSRDPEVIFNLNKKPTKKSKPTLKKDIVSPKVCAMAVKYSCSNRQLYELAAAITTEVSPNDKTLSVSTARRKK